jgi:hypothetical protein
VIGNAVKAGRLAKFFDKAYREGRFICRLRDSLFQREFCRKLFVRLVLGEEKKVCAANNECALELSFSRMRGRMK